MNFAAIHGSRLEVQQIAGSPALAPIVFLHEGLGSVSLWTQRGRNWPQEVCQASGRAGLVYSRRGYGQSDPVPDVRQAGRLQPDYMHREAWEVLPALLASLGIAQPVLLGHSDGASIALLHASRQPVSALIVMAPHLMVEDIAIAAIAQAREAFERSEGPPRASSAPSCDERGSEPPKAREATSVGAMNPAPGRPKPGCAPSGGSEVHAVTSVGAPNKSGGLRERLARHHADVDGAFWQWNDVWLSQAFRGFDIRPECRRISAPLLAIQGLGDEYGTLAQLDALALAAPQTVQLRLADCGHSPQRDQPEKTLEAIAGFLRPLP